MLHSYWRGLPQLTALFEINLNQMTVNALVFNVWEKEQLAIKLPDDFSVKIIVPRDSADSFNVAMKS